MQIFHRKRRYSIFAAFFFVFMIVIAILLAGCSQPQTEAAPTSTQTVTATHTPTPAKIVLDDPDFGYVTFVASQNGRTVTVEIVAGVDIITLKVQPGDSQTAKLAPKTYPYTTKMSGAKAAATSTASADETAVSQPTEVIVKAGEQTIIYLNNKGETTVVTVSTPEP